MREWPVSGPGVGCIHPPSGLYLRYESENKIIISLILNYQYRFNNLEIFGKIIDKEAQIYIFISKLTKAITGGSKTNKCISSCSL